MPRVPCRKFTLADIMALVAATAAGLALARPVLKTLNEPWFYSYPMGVGSPLLAAWSLAMLGIRLKRPRPAFRRLFRQPGAAAALACSSAFLFWAAFIGAEWLRRNRKDALEGFAYSAISAGPAAIGVWLVMLVSGTIRFEPGWIDRAGLAVGVGWMALLLVVLTVVVLR